MNLLEVSQLIAILAACWAIISGVDAWKREFIGKRKIELAEQTLANFYEIKDAIAYIRNPFSYEDEGKTRAKNDNESKEDSNLLDRGYVVIERYSKKETIFSNFSALRYKFMASFGIEHEKIFTDTYTTINSIFISARMLATHYWKHRGNVDIESPQFKKHLEEMHKHEGIFWDINNDEDEIRLKLNQIQIELETIVKPYFKEKMTLYSILTNKVENYFKNTCNNNFF